MLDFKETIEKEAKENCEYNQDSLRQYDKHFIQAFKDGAETMQLLYEEKLRWIPVTENMPENLEWVDCKSGFGDHYVGCYLENYGIKTCEPATITHWRSFL